MKKNIWFWGFLLLLVLNIAAISSMFIHRRAVERECGYNQNCQNPMDRYHHLKKELRLNDEQWQEFKRIRNEHHETMVFLRNSLRDNHLKVFNLVSSDSQDKVALDSLKSEICNLHNQISDESINYYKQAKSVCSEQQLNALNEHFRRMFMRPDRNPNCHPGKNN